MPYMMIIIYTIIFIFQIVFLVKAIKNKAKEYWIKVFALEIISIIISTILLFYYNGLSGYGFMPGLSYLGESLLSLGVTILYSVMLFITILIMILIICFH